MYFTVTESLRNAADVGAAAELCSLHHIRLANPQLKILQV